MVTNKSEKRSIRKNGSDMLHDGVDRSLKILWKILSGPRIERRFMENTSDRRS